MKKIIPIILCALALASTIFVILYNKKQEQIKQEKKDKINDINTHYNEYVKTGENVKLYDKNKNEIGYISNIELTLNKQAIDENSEYFYIPTIDSYIYYKDVVKIDKLTEEEYITYKNYVPFNKEIKTVKNIKIYIDENTYYSFNDNAITFKPIIIDNDKYYFVFNDRLSYILKEQIESEKETDNVNTTSKIAVLNYHYIVNKEAGELKECTQSICITDTQYEQQIKYLKDNNFYTATMRDLELWIDKKINLPEKTVVITIDDGWYVARNIQILEKYDVHATLFLIGHLASPADYKSKNLEIHSHGWNIHNIGECPGNLGGAILCKDKNYLLEDLKKSRESLNNTTYFCYPFYEYNTRAIEILKEAGFTMAFKGGRVKATQGINKFLVPRYSIINTTTLNQFISFVN